MRVHLAHDRIPTYCGQFIYRNQRVSEFLQDATCKHCLAAYENEQKSLRCDDCCETLASVADHRHSGE